MLSKAGLISRYILGIIFVIFGINTFVVLFNGVGFVPVPPPAPALVTVMEGFHATIYLMPLIAGLQVVSGLFFLSGFFINAGIVLLGPIIVNMLLIHVFIEPQRLILAILTTLLFIILLSSRWSDFRNFIKK